jgi:hypothetical protein
VPWRRKRADAGGGQLGGCHATGIWRLFSAGLRVILFYVVSVDCLQVLYQSLSVKNASALADSLQEKYTINLRTKRIVLQRTEIVKTMKLTNFFKTFSMDWKFFSGSFSRTRYS